MHVVQDEREDHLLGVVAGAVRGVVLEEVRRALGEVDGVDLARAVAAADTIWVQPQAATVLVQVMPSTSTRNTRVLTVTCVLSCLSQAEATGKGQDAIVVDLPASQRSE